MRYFLLLTFTLIIFKSQAQTFEHQNIELLGRWTVPNDKIAEYGTIFSSCLAYAADNREYAIVGCANGTAYIDITDPTKPTFVQFLNSRVHNATWREYKTYQHYAYQISDDNGDNHFDIVDLSYLPDSVHIVYSGSEEYFRTGHTIFMDGDKMYIGLHNHTSMSVFSLANDPTKPEFLRLLSDDYPGDVHDMYVRNDTVYASKGWDGALQILEFKNNKFTEIGNFNNYPFAGYNHSSILTPDGKTLIFTDEVPGNLPAKSIDVTDPANPILLDTFYSQTGRAALHNPFLAPNNTMVMASYEDGIQVYDYSNPSEIKLRGYFDTHYQSIGEGTSDGYSGAWSAYTELPSKNIVVVDRQNGLYVLDATEAYYPETSSVKQNVKVQKLYTFPSPAINNFKIQLPENATGAFDIRIMDVNGKLIYQNIMDSGQLETKVFNSSSWAKGVYMIKMVQGDKMYVAEQIIN